MTRAPIGGIGVVIPVHNEEDDLGACLSSVIAAARPVPVPTRVVVVLDSCHDGSARVARRSASASGPVTVEILEGAYDGVGSVRAAGVRRVQKIFAGTDPATVWTAHTDADTLVPPHWLHTQRVLADDGWDVVLGAVVPDGDPLHPAHRLWSSRHPPEEGHPHVHGANLGLRLNRYLDVGGFRALSTGEDVDIVERLTEITARRIATSRHRVLTSARREGRAPSGFAAYMRDLDEEASTIHPHLKPGV